MKECRGSKESGRKDILGHQCHCLLERAIRLIVPADHVTMITGNARVLWQHLSMMARPKYAPYPGME
jgi:hypothetical protein